MDIASSCHMKVSNLKSHNTTIKYCKVGWTKGERGMHD
jgi:hypothetical protein